MWCRPFQNSSSRPWPRTPLSIFGAATENYGSLAKKTLLFAVLLGIAAVGYQAGKIAGRLTRITGTGFSGRLLAGAIVAGALALHQPGHHANCLSRRVRPGSSYTEDILIQMTATFALFALVWAVAPVLLRGGDLRGAGVSEVDRRTVLKEGVFDAATLGAMVAAGVAGWRLVHPKADPVDTTATKAVDDIVATQRALQGRTTTPTPEAQVARESASLTSDLAIVQDDVFALFDDPDA